MTVAFQPPSSGHTTIDVIIDREGLLAYGIAANCQVLPSGRTLREATMSAGARCGALGLAKRQRQRSPRRASSLRRVWALNEVSIVDDEQFCAPTLLNEISGLHQPGAGQLLRDDGPIGGLSGSAQ